MRGAIEHKSSIEWKPCHQWVGFSPIYLYSWQAFVFLTILLLRHNEIHQNYAYPKWPLSCEKIPLAIENAKRCEAEMRKWVLIRSNGRRDEAWLASHGKFQAMMRKESTTKSPADQVAWTFLLLMIFVPSCHLCNVHTPTSIALTPVVVKRSCLFAIIYSAIVVMRSIWWQRNQVTCVPCETRMGSDETYAFATMGGYSLDRHTDQKSVLGCPAE